MSAATRTAPRIIAEGPALTPEDVAERMGAITDTYGTDRPGPVAVVDGFGCRVRVERGRLELADGVGEHRRVRTFDKATHQLARVVVFGDGIVTTEALRWCAGAGIGVLVASPFGGELLLTSATTGNDDARLRRQQALALHSAAGLAVARYLIAGKIAGQAQVAATLLGSPGTHETLAGLLADLDRCATLEDVQQVEAVAAAAYFAAWDGIEVRFVGRDAAKVPAHWRTFSGRRSAVNPGSARSATDPVNAMLNYAYRLLEAEARLGCIRVGLDPGLGVMHADVKGRDSLTLDLLEVARPLVDQAVLELIATRPLRRRDFVEDRRGVVRVTAPLTHELAGLMAGWGALLAPAIEHVAVLFATESGYAVSVPTVLTRSKHKQAARRRVDEAREAGELLPARGPNPGGIAPRTAPRQAPRIDPGGRLAPICAGCGASLPVPPGRATPVRSYCPACLPDRRADVDRNMHEASLVHAATVAATTGTRPSHTPEARSRRREANRVQRLDQLARSATTEAPGDLAWFRSTVFPALATLTLPAIARACNVSTSAASKWRRGVDVPAPWHWATLAALAGVDGLTHAPVTPEEQTGV